MSSNGVYSLQEEEVEVTEKDEKRSLSCPMLISWIAIKYVNFY